MRGVYDSDQNWRLFLLQTVVSFVALAGPVCGAQTSITNSAPSQPGPQPVSITLQEAIKRAESSDPALAAAKASSQSAALDRSIARAGLLPNAHVLAQGIYTQPNGLYSES